MWDGEETRGLIKNTNKTYSVRLLHQMVSHTARIPFRILKYCNNEI